MSYCIINGRPCLWFLTKRRSSLQLWVLVKASIVLTGQMLELDQRDTVPSHRTDT